MFLDIDGNQVFTLDFGPGPRTLLAHSGWIGNFEDWICALAPLSKSWRTVVYDHRGTGETRVPVDRISHESLIDDVFRLMDALKIDRCVLAGFSRGAITALRAVLRHPDRFEGLVLMNGHAGVVPPGTTATARPPFPTWPGETFRDKLEWFAQLFTPEPGTEHVRRWATNILSRATPEAAERINAMEPVETIDWETALPTIRIPTLLIHGARDPLCSEPAMRYIESRIAGSKLVVLEGAGHIPAMVQPMTIAREIEAYFAAPRATPIHPHQPATATGV